MKKIILGIVFVFATVSMVNAENLKIDDGLSINKYQITQTIQNNSLFLIENVNCLNEEVESVKCWAFKQWLKAKLKEISDDTELINETADALKELCEIANDLGWV